MDAPNEYTLSLTVNGRSVVKILIGRHYKLKHGHYMTDDLILELVMALDGENFPVDSATNGIDYYAADVVHSDQMNRRRMYRLIWIFEGKKMEILGVVNAYRRRKRRVE